MDVAATVQLTTEDRRALAQIIGCAERDLVGRLAAFASAAATEYVTMILGQKVFRRGSDLLEYRLFLLVREVFDNQIPDEQDVCNLFQTTASESRSLIRSVMSKYQYQLKVAIERSMRRVIETAEQAEDDKPFTVTVNSANVIDELNRVLAEIDGSLPSVSKKRGSVSTYEIAASSHARLWARFGIEPRELRRE